MNDQSRSSRASSEPVWIDVDPSKDYTRPPPLSRARIVRAALRLVDEKGLTALTMRVLATDLEVSPMALYNHVRDKDELVDLMVDLVLGEVDTSPVDGDWLTQLRALVRSYHGALVAHHQLARIYSGRVSIGPHGLLIIERALELLLQGGFSPSDAADAFLALFTYTAGFHQIGRIAPLWEATPKGGAGHSPPPPEKIPALTVVSPHLGGVHQPGRFDYGLELLLAGLQMKSSRAGQDDVGPG